MKQKTEPSPKRYTTRGIWAVAIAALLLTAAVALIARPALLARLGFSQPPAAETTGPTEFPLNENPYGPGDFAYDGAYLSCLAGPAKLGVDVSSHQQDIDWAQVADAGMEFAMIRIGYRGYGAAGTVQMDEYAGQNLLGARQAGLQVGAYFFSQAVSIPEAAAEAASCIEFLQDYELDLPVVFDWEYVSEEARSTSVDPDTLLQCALVFCQAMERAGYQPMIYFNPHVARDYLDVTQLSQYPFWLAQYQDQLDYPHAVEMWQYTNKGTVPGIPGDADINLWFTD